MRLKCRSCYSAQVRRKAWRVLPIMHHECAIPAQRAHEQPQLKQHVVSWRSSLGIPTRHHVVGSKNHDGKVKAGNLCDQSFKRALAKSKNTVGPGFNLAVVIQTQLQMLGDG